MKVHLDVMWFDGSRRWRPGDHDMPNSLKEKLPPDAVILDEGEAKKAEKKEESEALSFAKNRK